jgi:16S rRNA (adenine1518-N6/adenine1519-N6)-dimethyltransferase
VGPGRGVLTRPLLGRCKELTAVELDEKLCALLRAELGADPRFKLIEGDFLAIPDSALPEGPLKFAGNLPYAVGGPILRRIVHRPGWIQAVAMLQKEVALRLLAGPGDEHYGPLGLEMSLRASVDWVSEVPPDCFSPPPKVDSAVVVLQPRSVDLGGASEAAVLGAVYASFRHRRKTILNSVSLSLGLERPKAAEALEDSGIEPGARAETVPLEAYIRLGRRLPQASGL